MTATDAMAKRGQAALDSRRVIRAEIILEVMVGAASVADAQVDLGAGFQVDAYAADLQNAPAAAQSA